MARTGLLLHIFKRRTLCFRVHSCRLVLSAVVALTCFLVVRITLSSRLSLSGTWPAVEGKDSITEHSDIVQFFSTKPLIPPRSLIVIISATQTVLQSPFPSEIIVLCAPSDLLDCKKAIREAVDLTDPFRDGGPLLTDERLEVLLKPFEASQDIEITTEARWILVVDDQGLEDSLLDNPKAAEFPYGPVGLNNDTRTCPEEPQILSQLLPPYIMPLPADTPKLSSKILKQSPTPGVALHVSKRLCLKARGPSSSHSEGFLTVREGSVIAVLPTLTDALNFSRALCAFYTRGVIVRIAIYHEDHPMYSSPLSYTPLTLPCGLSYTFIEPNQLSEDILAEDKGHSLSPAILFFVSDLENEDQQSPSLPSRTMIRLPRAQLEFTDWIGSLDLDELQNWHKPRLSISIITHQRPTSLQRLLDSLSKSLLFGSQTLMVHIHMEDTADSITRHIAETFEWRYGPVAVSHRVVKGGLLPAVVESWFPRGNDSYGLLLEDDVELSPMWWAWSMMSLLRYRYGSQKNIRPNLFGISLYQPKINELHAGGIKPPLPRTLFAQKGIDPNHPYLSQVPCSWGAIYFPEHWRQFHSYLILRLSQTMLSLPTKGEQSIIVPNIRSNRWSRSWKKYFIELAYLRGYVMLYPNYDAFLSFSTNHVEVGAHVKTKSKSRIENFFVPLFPLPGKGRHEIGGREHSGLLQLPGGALPAWEDLPVLDFWGEVSDLGTLMDAGTARRDELVKVKCAAKDVSDEHPVHREIFSVDDLKCPFLVKV
ncbi:hypothetical protein DL96DRAFT_1583566 [Flagelloscypha sp. PMI_526]|nr:hypothetical protein DL96DRAFT_1583566 [Flagelloscypha sp. PMI_526]